MIFLFSVISRHSLVRVLHLCRDAVGVFYSPCWLGWDGLVSCRGHSLVRVLPLCRDAVGVFYSLSWLGNQKCYRNFLCIFMESIFKACRKVAFFIELLQLFHVPEVRSNRQHLSSLFKRNESWIYCLTPVASSRTISPCPTGASFFERGSQGENLYSLIPTRSGMGKIVFSTCFRFLYPLSSQF